MIIGSGWLNKSAGHGHLVGSYYKKNDNDMTYTLVIANSGSGLENHKNH